MVNVRFLGLIFVAKLKKLPKNPKNKHMQWPVNVKVMKLLYI